MRISPGNIFAKDFVKEINMHGLKISETELERICKITDKTGQVQRNI